MKNIKINIPKKTIKQLDKNYKKQKTVWDTVMSDVKNPDDKEEVFKAAFKYIRNFKK
jgi:hypothetical protein